mmetsp:Transcript_34312/g.83477  ORF Transcript_34312/g.83477 Transcript_34312/m.83477 type:complete len:340 (+) Transcript_34312:125-1144(+)
MSTSFHPQTDGKVERMNAVLEEVLRCHCHQTEKDWVSFLPSSEFAINGSHSDAIGMTPFMANYGFEPLAPWAVAPASLDMPDVEARLSMLHEVHSLCRDALQRAKDRMLRYSSRRRREVTYRVGDRVLLVSKNLTYNPDGNTCRKLASVYLGPFLITNATDNTVTVDLPAQLVSAGLQPTFNVSLVRPNYPRPDWQPSTVVEPVLVHNEKQYLIDSLVAQRTQADGKAPEYLVRWKGYDSSEDTWVSAEDIDPVTRAAFDNLHPESNALASDRPDVSDAQPFAFPPTWTVTGNVLGELDGSVGATRARDWLDARSRHTPTSRCVLVAPSSPTRQSVRHR